MIRPAADLAWIRELGFRSWWCCIFEHRLKSYGSVFAKRWDHRLVQWLGHQIHDWRRRLEGARAVEQGDTRGFICETGLDIEFSGMCPVQGDGFVDGRVCYYRSRGDGWQFSVAPLNVDPDSEFAALAEGAWEHAENPYIWPAGGYVARSVSEACIRKAIALWRKAGRP